MQSTYTIGSHPIALVSTQKDLGVAVNSNFKWGSHISNMSSKTNKMLGFLYRASNRHFDSKAKRTLYLSLVISYLGYASEVWTPLNIGGLRLVERIQRRGTKFILGYPDAALPYKQRLLKLNLLPVSYWHEIRDLVFFFKAINDFYNIDLSDFIQPKVVRCTRQSCSLDYKLNNNCRTSLFQRSFFKVVLHDAIFLATCNNSLNVAS